MSTRPRERRPARRRLLTHDDLCPCTTARHLDFVDLTDDVQAAVAASGVRAGRVTVSSPGEDCPIVVNERESGLLQDIRAAVGRVRAVEGNGRPLAVGATSVVLPIVGGRVRLGTWQRILLFELGRPGDRSAFVQIVGEA